MKSSARLCRRRLLLYVAAIALVMGFAASPGSSRAETPTPCAPPGCVQLERVTITGSVPLMMDSADFLPEAFLISFRFEPVLTLPDTVDETLAKLIKNFDVRCSAAPALANVKSTDTADERRRAAQSAYDNLAQRVAEGPFSSAWRAITGNLRQVTVTYADGGMETFSVVGLFNSANLVSTGNLTVGSGAVEPLPPGNCPLA